MNLLIMKYIFISFLNKIFIYELNRIKVDIS